MYLYTIFRKAWHYYSVIKGSVDVEQLAKSYLYYASPITLVLELILIAAYCLSSSSSSLLII